MKDRFVVELLLERTDSDTDRGTIAAAVNVMVKQNCNPLVFRPVGFTFRDERPDLPTISAQDLADRWG